MIIKLQPANAGTPTHAQSLADVFAEAHRRYQHADNAFDDAAIERAQAVIGSCEVAAEVAPVADFADLAFRIAYARSMIDTMAANAAAGICIDAEADAAERVLAKAFAGLERLAGVKREDHGFEYYVGNVA